MSAHNFFDRQRLDTLPSGVTTKGFDRESPFFCPACALAVWLAPYMHWPDWPPASFDRLAVVRFSHPLLTYAPKKVSDRIAAQRSNHITHLILRSVEIYVFGFCNFWSHFDPIMELSVFAPKQPSAPGVGPYPAPAILATSPWEGDTVVQPHPSALPSRLLVVPSSSRCIGFPGGEPQAPPGGHRFGGYRAPGHAPPPAPHRLTSLHPTHLTALSPLSHGPLFLSAGGGSLRICLKVSTRAKKREWSHISPSSFHHHFCLNPLAIFFSPVFSPLIDEIVFEARIPPTPASPGGPWPRPPSLRPGRPTGSRRSPSASSRYCPPLTPPVHNPQTVRKRTETGLRPTSWFLRQNRQKLVARVHKGAFPGSFGRST